VISEELSQKNKGVPLNPSFSRQVQHCRSSSSSSASGNGEICCASLYVEDETRVELINGRRYVDSCSLGGATDRTAPLLYDDQRLTSVLRRSARRANDLLPCSFRKA